MRSTGTMIAAGAGGVGGSGGVGDSGGGGATGGADASGMFGSSTSVLATGVLGVAFGIASVRGFGLFCGGVAV